MQLAIAILLSSVIMGASETSLEINLIGLTPNGELLAWHEKGSSRAGENERYVIAKTIGLSHTDIFTVSNPLIAAVVMDKSEMAKKARQRIKKLGIKSGCGTQEINDIYGNYRQLGYAARLYLKISPSHQEYNLEAYDEMSGRTRVVASDKIPTADPSIIGKFKIRQARLSRDRSTCAVVVEQQYETEGKHTVDKLYTFMVFAAPPPEMPPPGGPPPRGGPPPD
jgi:hypothetical protein